MTTKLAADKDVVREIAMTVMDKGTRPLIFTLRGDGYVELRAKGMQRVVVWSAAALYERGVREGRVK